MMVQRPGPENMHGQKEFSRKGKKETKVKRKKIAHGHLFLLLLIELMDNLLYGY